jgi:CRP-like cAMP-binding protein/RsiW-degrading membrane proteinase PrsW (M82 family)
LNVVSLSIAYIIAIAVPAFSIYVIYALDFFGTGKRNIILTCAVWGAIGAFGIAFVANTAMQNAFSLEFRTISTRTAPVLEELLKGIILLYFVQRPSFVYFVDGAIYGFATGIGFAMAENVFYVAQNADEAVLSLAVSRVLSASLMHATANAVMGIAFGLSRREKGWRKFTSQALGVLFAIVVHFIYNNLLFELQGRGAFLLLTAIGIGVGGGVFIAVAMNIGLSEEKKRFNQTLGLSMGVTDHERRGVQSLGSEAMEEILHEMEQKFGAEKADFIRRLFVVQANIGILKNNLASPVGERLRQAWQAEIDSMTAEMDDIRRALGSYAMSFLRSLLPADGEAAWGDLTSRIADYDPHHVHTFDLYLHKLAPTKSAEQIENISNRLKKIGIFQHVDLGDLDNLSRSIAFSEYVSGQMLFDKNQEGSAMYLIDRGAIDIFTVDSEGQEKIFRTYRKGEVVGELSLLDGQPRSARARANGSLRVMVLERDNFMRFVRSRPRVQLSVLQFLADRVRYTTEAIRGVQAVVQTQGVEEDTGSMDPLLHVSDSVAAPENKALGVFGRMAQVLDKIEQEGGKK